MKDYKRLTNNNRDEYDPEYDFCCDCKYFGEPCGCNRPNGTCGNYDRFLETYNRLAEFEDKIENGTLIDLPCKIGDTVWLANPDGRLIYGKVSAIGYKWETDASNNSVSQYACFMARCPEEFYVKRGDDAIYGFSFENNKIRERVFLSEDEARKKLKELEK